MSVTMLNDFEISDVEGGKLYRLESDGGHADVLNYFFEPGMVVNLVTMNTPHYTNQDRVGAMNYLMIVMTVHGRSNYEIDGT